MNEERADRTPNRRAIPFHPVLFAVAPILFCYTYSCARIPLDPRELLLPVALTLATTALLWTVLGLLLRSVTRSALLVSLFLVLFFSYGHVARTIGLRYQAWPDLFLFWALLMTAGTWLVVRRPRDAVRGTQFGITVLLNSIAAAILVVNLAAGVCALTHRPPRPEVTHRATSEPALPVGAHPDIYYIILDGYARADILKSMYGYENSGFLDRLRQMGFYVAGRSRSNYCQTDLSLASSLNLTYLDSIAHALGPDSRDRWSLHDLVARNRLMAFLRRQGYAVMAFATGFTATDLRDVEFYRAPLWSTSQFHQALLGTTPVPPFLRIFGLNVQFDLHRDRILYALDHLADAAHIGSPVFVFAHITAPHPPFVFGADGEHRSPNGDYTLSDGSDFHGMNPMRRSDYVAGYRDQLAFISARIVSALGRIMAESQSPPYVVLQSDHGPGSRLNWRSAESTDMAERTSILNAYYFPDRDYRNLYDSITPVNTFRLLLNKVFRVPCDLLPDRSYFSPWERPYSLTPVDSLRSAAE